MAEKLDATAGVNRLPITDTVVSTVTKEEIAKQKWIRETLGVFIEATPDSDREKPNVSNSARGAFEKPDPNLVGGNVAVEIGKAWSMSLERQVAGIKQDINSNKLFAEQQDKLNTKQFSDNIMAMKKAESAGFWGKVFGWVAPILGLVAAVTMIATGVGAAAGGLLLAGSVLGLGMQIFNEVGGTKWLEGQIGKTGVEAFTYTMLGIQLLLTVGGGLTSIPTIAAKLPQLFAANLDLLGTLALGNAARYVALTVKVATGVFSGLSQAGQGASGIAATLFSYEAAGARKGMVETQARQAANSEEYSILMSDFKRVMQANGDLWTQVMTILRGVQALTSRVIQNV
jgi:hypothetical protein